MLFLLLLPVVWFAALLPFSYPWDAAARAVIQSGAQAAALGCAAQATVTRQVDAGGYVYHSTVVVRPHAGPVAAAAALLPSADWCLAVTLGSLASLAAFAVVTVAAVMRLAVAW